MSGTVSARSSGAGTFIYVAPTFSADIWIAPDGDDNTGDGSEGNPLLNLNTAINWASAGDIIACKGGTYTPAALLDVYEGKDDLTIIAAPGEVPIFDAINYPTDGEGGFNDRVIRLQDVSGVTIDGLRFTRGPDGGMQIIGTTSGITIRRCHFYANGRTSLYEGEGFVCEGSHTDLLVEDCDSYWNYDELGDAGQNADGFRISIYAGSATFRHCRAWRNSDDGFDTFNNSFSTSVSTVPVMFDRCWSWENGILAGGSDSLGDGMGFKLGGQRDVSNDSGGNTVTGCLSWGNRANGFTDNSATIANDISNCTAYDNGSISFETNADETVVTDCISYAPGSAHTNIADPTNVSGNSWQSASAPKDADFVNLDETTATASRPWNGAQPNTTFLRMDPDSRFAAIGAWA